MSNKVALHRQRCSIKGTDGCIAGRGVLACGEVAKRVTGYVKSMYTRDEKKRREEEYQR